MAEDREAEFFAWMNNAIEDCVRKHFNFLKDEYGFIDWSDDIDLGYGTSWGGGFGYANADLRFEAYWGNGELDIVVQVTRVDEIFRPYVSRQFYLRGVIEGLKKGKIEYPADYPPGFPVDPVKDFPPMRYASLSAGVRRRLSLIDDRSTFFLYTSITGSFSNGKGLIRIALLLYPRSILRRFD